MPALTGMSAGHLVRVPDEVNRLERHTGGAIHSVNRWRIIGPNTYQLIATKGDAGEPTMMTLNGIEVRRETVME